MPLAFETFDLRPPRINPASISLYQRCQCVLQGRNLPALRENPGSELRGTTVPLLPVIFRGLHRIDRDEFGPYIGRTEASALIRRKKLSVGPREWWGAWIRRPI
jgi:hypothetical protein